MFGHAQDLDSYITYLRDTVKLPAMDVQLNGGAQFRRLHPFAVWKWQKPSRSKQCFLCYVPSQVDVWGWGFHTLCWTWQKAWASGCHPSQVLILPPSFDRMALFTYLRLGDRVCENALGRSAIGIEKKARFVFLLIPDLCAIFFCWHQPNVSEKGHHHSAYDADTWDCFF